MDHPLFYLHGIQWLAKTNSVLTFMKVIVWGRRTLLWKWPCKKSKITTSRNTPGVPVSMRMCDRDIQRRILWRSGVWPEIWQIHKYWLRKGIGRVHSREQEAPESGSSICKHPLVARSMECLRNWTEASMVGAWGARELGRQMLAERQAEARQQRRSQVL